MSAKNTKRTVAVKERAGVPKTEKIFMVRRTFPGVTYGPIPLERGRLIRMLGLKNDQQMLRLEYIEELMNPDSVTPTFTPDEMSDERIIERENKIAPLAMDKTAASRK